MLGLMVAATNSADATNYYWDANGSTAGAGDTPSGTWGSSAFWNTNTTGGSGTFITTTGTGDDLSFIATPAANSGENPFTVTVSGTQDAHSLTFQSSGATTLSGSGTIDLWGGGISVPQIAYGTTSQGAVTISAAISLEAAQVWTNNSVSALSVEGNVANGGNTLTIGGAGNTTYSGAMSGTGALTKTGLGTLTVTEANSFSGGVTVAGGMLTVASSGSLTTGSGKSIYVGYTGPAAMTIQDSGSVTASELDVNFQGTSAASPSVLTFTGGSLSVSGQTYIGRAATLGDSSTTSAAVYQSGGTATFSGLITVGYNGTASSLYDIDGGVLTASAGLLVGGNSGNGNSGQGNGVLNIHGSGTVNVSGGSGLLIGQDANETTSGSLNLSSGTLSVTGNVTLGSGGGIGTLSRSGGSFSVSGGLAVAGNATLILDATTGSVATSFGGGLSHSGLGTLVVVPVTGALGAGEAVSFGTNPLPGGSTIIGPWAVRETSATNTTGDFLTTTGTGPYQLTTATYDSTNFSGATSSSIVNVSGTPSVTSSITVSAMKVSGTATISSGQTLTLGSGGMILNGGTVTGGTLAFGATPLVFAGTASSSTIASSIQSSAGLVKFGPGTLILSADNSQTLSDTLFINDGTLNVRNSGALGAGGTGSPVTVATGAALELQNNVSIANVPITLNGSGPSGGGSLRNVQDNNSLGGEISLTSNSQINTAAGTLTLSGAIQGSYTLTKAGSGTLVIAGSSGSAFPAAVLVSSGTMRVQNSDALGSGGGLVSVAVTSGATLQLQNEIAVPNVLLTLSGTGTGSNGAIENVQGSNSFAGAITLASNSQVNIDSASDTLTLSGAIGGSFALTKGDAGTLILAGTNSFTESLSALSGTLRVASVNNSGSSGPLGAGTAPISLGSSGNTATFLYTGSSATTNRAFTMAGLGGLFSSANSLGLTGVIDGNGGLTQMGAGTFTLGAANLYSGPTTVTTGTLAVSSTGSINGTTSISIGPGGILQVTAGSSSGGQLPDSGNITLAGGSLTFIDNGATNPGELAGALVLNPGQNNVTASNSGSGTPYLRFASAPLSHTVGATVDFTSTSAAVEYQTNPPALSNGIIGGYAFTSNAGFTTVDFATLTSTTPYTIQAYASYTTGNLGALASMSSANVAPSGSQTTVSSSKTFNSLKLTGSIGVTIGSGDSLGFGSGGIIANTTGTISGGTLAAPNGEMIINAVEHMTVSSAINADVALVKTGSATLTLTSTTPLNGNTYLNQGTLEYAPASDLEYDGAMYGAGNLLKSGSAMLTLGGDSSYFGSTSVTGGTLCVNGSLGTGTTVGLQAAVLTGYGTVGGNVNVTSSGGTIAMSSAGTIGGQVTDSSGVLTVGQTGGSNYLNTTGGVNISGTGTLVANSTAATISGSLRYTSSANSSFTGVISGASTLTLNSTSGTTLTLSGADTFSGGAIIQSGTLIKQGTSTLAITGAPTLGSAGVLTVSAGTLEFNVTSGTASIQSGFTATVAAAATLQLAGTVSALSDGSALNPSDGQLVNITNNGATASGGGLLVTGTNQSVGVVAGDSTTSGGATTYGGDTVVGDGTNAADLTATQILQNTLTINAGSTVTIRPSGSGISGDAIVSSIAASSIASASPAIASDDDNSSSSDPFMAIQAAIAAGSISSVAGQRLENRLAAIERLAATDPGLDVSLLENRVLASLGPSSLLSASSDSPTTETGSGLLAIDNSALAFDSAIGGATSGLSPVSGFGDGSELGSGGAPVPEPGTFMLVCIAAVGLGLFQLQTRIGR